MGNEQIIEIYVEDAAELSKKLQQLEAAGFDLAGRIYLKESDC